jgi:hypothetical protein
MKYSIRILNSDGTFQAYLSTNDRTAWSRSQCNRHIAEAKKLEHFAGCTFVLEESQCGY